MRCKNVFLDDRVCDMCKLVNNRYYLECVDVTNKKIELNNKLYEISNKCSYRMTAWDERNQFDACNKNGKGYGRFADECNVCLECEKYIK